MNDDANQTLWQQVEDAFDSRSPVTGGFSPAEKGIVTLASGKRLFVKIGRDDNTKGWANKEIAAYSWLNQVGFPYAPRLFAHGDGGFAIEDLSMYDFSSSWTEKKLAATLRAMDTLATYSAPEAFNRLSDFESGWHSIVQNPELLNTLKERSDDHFITQLSLESANEYAKQVDGLAAQNAELAHIDVRADNLAYDERADKVYLIDWNWLGMINPLIDRLAFLVSVQRSGFDITTSHAHLISKDAALFLAGYWLYEATRPVWPGANPGIRTHQLESGLVCLHWALGDN